MSSPEPSTQSSRQVAVDKEQGLKRQLSARQMAMIGIGGALGIGFFLRTSLGVHVAGPAVLVTYLIGGLDRQSYSPPRWPKWPWPIPPQAPSASTPKSTSPEWAGFAVRYAYWFAMAAGMGGQAIAVAIYFQWWFPNVPGWIWIVCVTAGLIYLNMLKVGNFGELEYWLSMIKILAICFFILFGIILILGIGHGTPIGLSNYRLPAASFPMAGLPHGPA